MIQTIAMIGVFITLVCCAAGVGLIVYFVFDSIDDLLNH